MPKVSKKSATKGADHGPVIDRADEIAGYTVNFVEFRQDIDGTPLLAADTQAAVLLPAGATGPAFLVFRNFDAIYSYNAAESYALAIATLSDRLRGGGALVTPWPTDDPGLGRGERKQLQQLLLARGHAIGEADGMIGTLTRRAHLRSKSREAVSRNGPSIDLHALGDINQVRRRVKPGSQSGGLRHLCNHRGRRAFAISARDMSGAESFLRVTELMKKSLDAFETKLHRERFVPEAQKVLK